MRSSHLTEMLTSWDICCITFFSYCYVWPACDRLRRNTRPTKLLHILRPHLRCSWRCSVCLRRALSGDSAGRRYCSWCRSVANYYSHIKQRSFGHQLTASIVSNQKLRRMKFCGRVEFTGATDLLLLLLSTIQH